MILDDEIRRFEYKVEAGAEFVVTEPVFDAADLELPVAHRRRGLPIIATIRPFESLRHAECLANEVPSVRVPDALLERMRARSSWRRAEEGDRHRAGAGAAHPADGQGVHVTAPSVVPSRARAVLSALLASTIGTGLSSVRRAYSARRRARFASGRDRICGLPSPDEGAG